MTKTDENSELTSDPWNTQPVVRDLLTKCINVISTRAKVKLK